MEQQKLELPTLPETPQSKKRIKSDLPKKGYSVNVNGREVSVAYRTLKKRKEVR
tara:strand:- start:354 stop:515 length:162 start_codon:yes stop_codon:yes gene_type:complete